MHSQVFDGCCVVVSPVGVGIEVRIFNFKFEIKLDGCELNLYI